MVAYSSLHALRVLDPVLPWKHSHVIKLCQQRVIVDHPMATCPQSVKNWWAEHSQTLCRLGEVFLAFASGVLTVVSFGSPFWIENGTSVDHQGLWQECQITPDASCKPLSDVSGSLELYMCYKHSSLSNQKCFISLLLAHRCCDGHKSNDVLGIAVWTGGLGCQCWCSSGAQTQDTASRSHSIWTAR